MTSDPRHAVARSSGGSGFGRVPVSNPGTHVPTLPPRAPAPLRYIGVVIGVLSAAVVVVVLSLVAFLPRRTLPAAPSTTSTSTPPAPASPPSTTTPTPDGDAVIDLAAVPLVETWADARASHERAMRRKGLRPGDVPAIDALVARANAQQRAGDENAAVDTLHEATRKAIATVVDRGFVFSKQKRLRLALEERGSTDAKRIAELEAEITKKFANHDYAGANDALNRAFALVR